MILMTILVMSHENLRREVVKSDRQQFGIIHSHKYVLSI